MTWFLCFRKRCENLSLSTVKRRLSVFGSRSFEITKSIQILSLSLKSDRPLVRLGRRRRRGRACELEGRWKFIKTCLLKKRSAESEPASR